MLAKRIWGADVTADSSYASFWGWLIAPGNAVAAAQLFAAVVTAGATIALWYVTRILAIETKVLSESASRPFVLCAFESSLADSRALNVVIRNTGNAPAFDILANITPALPRPDGSKDAEKVDTTYNISVLPPGAVLPKQGIMSTEIYGQDFTVSVSWSAFPRGKKRETLEFTTTAQDGFRGGWSTKGYHQIAEELEKIRKVVAK